MQFFSHDNKDYRSILDPRTKLLLLIAINVVMMGTGFQGTDFVLRMICAVIPFVLLLLIGKRRAALWYVIAGSVMLVCEGYVIPHTTGIINLLIVISTGMFSRILTGYAFAYYVMCSTTVSEFVTAMERMHMPDALTIPLSVTFRFFPTLAEESASIRDAMRLRGVGLAGKNKNLLTHLEYVIVPLMMSTLRIGDELSAASLTKGLGTGKRTHICTVRLKVTDYILMVFGVYLLIYMVFLR